MQGLHELQQNEMFIEEYYTAFDRVMGPFLSMVPKCEAGCLGCCAKKNKFIEKFLISFVMVCDLILSPFVSSC